MKLKLSLGLLLPLALLGCSGGKSEMTTFSNPAAISSVQVAQLQLINSARETTRGAMQAAFAPVAQNSIGSSSPTPDQKAQKIAAMIKAGNCAQVSIPPAERFDQDWSAQWQIQDQTGGSTCPVDILESSSFKNAGDIWQQNKTWNFKSNDLKAMVGLDGLSLRGSLQATSQNTKRSITGQFHYSPFNVASVGEVSADITVNANYVSLLGSGSVILTLVTSEGDQIKASVGWQGDGSNPTYLVNGAVMDQKSFEAMFSSFELTEIMDRALKMR